VTGGDVQKDQFVGTFEFITRRNLDRIPGISQLNKVGPFDDPAGVNVQTWDDAFGKHA
jgi:hypothetical protein